MCLRVVDYFLFAFVYLNGFGKLNSNDIYFFEGVLVDVLEILNVLRIESIDGACVAAQASVVIMIRGSIFQPRALMSSSSDL